MRTFRDFLVSTARLQRLDEMMRESHAGLFTETAREMVSPVEAPKPPTVHGSPIKAYEALRLNRPRKGLGDPPTIGLKGERCRSHVAYAWMPVVRKVKGKLITGIDALHVLHATKGWRIVHGWA